MADGVKVVGLEDLGRRLDLVQQKVQQQMVRTATRAGAVVYRDGMKSRVPRDSGDLANAITIKTKVRRDGDFEALIGPKYTGKVAARSRRPFRKPSTEDPGVYVQWVEFGRPGKSGHTHQSPEPFMRPTFDNDTPKVEQAFADSMKQQIGAELGS